MGMALPRPAKAMMNEPAPGSRQVMMPVAEAEPHDTLPDGVNPALADAMAAVDIRPQAQAERIAELEGLLAAHRLRAEFAASQERLNLRETKSLAALWHFRAHILHAADLPDEDALESIRGALKETEHGILVADLELIDGAGI